MLWCPCGGVGVCNVCDIDNDSFKCYFDQQSLIILLLCCVSFSPYLWSSSLLVLFKGRCGVFSLTSTVKSISTCCMLRMRQVL